jgi:hypothetical protein
VLPAVRRQRPGVLVLPPAAARFAGARGKRGEQSGDFSMASDMTLDLVAGACKLRVHLLRGSRSCPGFAPLILDLNSETSDF